MRTAVISTLSKDIDSWDDEIIQKGSTFMELNEIKQMIEQKTGVPAALLTGETAEENIAQAKALLAYRKELEGQEVVSKPKTTAQQFADWMNGNSNEVSLDLQDQVPKASAPEETIIDGGSVLNNGLITPGAESTAEQFGSWVDSQLSFNPFKKRDGWIPLL